MNIFGYNPNVRSKHAHIVDATVAYDEAETGQVFILLIHQAVGMKGLKHHLLFPMQCHMNGFLINEVPKFLAPVPGEITHFIQIMNTFDATHPIIIPELQVTSM